MSVHEIEQRLAAARKRVAEYFDTLRQSWHRDTQRAYWAAQEDVLVLERELAATRGEQHAIPLDFPVKWDAGSPRPHLICNDYRALLAFVVRVELPVPAGTVVDIAEPVHDKPRLLALVEFMPCTAARIGSPNDEVLQGHPLHGRGLEVYTAQQVMNSRWLAEVEAINKVHSLYDPAYWRDRNHYVFWFHDTMFECIAKSFAVEVHRESMPAMLARMCERIDS